MIENSKPALGCFRSAIIVATIVGVACILRDSMLLATYGINYSYDSLGYINLGKDFFNIIPEYLNHWRTIPYVLVNAVFSPWVNPYPLIIFQIGVSAIASSSLTYVIFKRNASIGLGIACLLVINIVWGSVNLAIASESTFISFHIICLVVLINHFDPLGVKYRPVDLFLSGLLYAWTLTIRPTSFFLIPVIIIVYCCAFHLGRRRFFVILGLTAFLFASATFNLVRFGDFSLVRSTGIAYAFPLFVYDGVNSKNGPASATIAKAFENCEIQEPRLPPSINESNAFVWSRAETCVGRVSTNLPSRYSLYRQAYIEFITNEPITYLKIVIEQCARCIAFPVNELSSFFLLRWQDQINAPGVCPFEWCARIFGTPARKPEPWVQSIEDFLGPVSQPYRAVAGFFVDFPIFDQKGHWPPPQNVRADILTMFFFSLMIVIIILRARGIVLVLALASIIFISATVCATVTAHVMLPRYTVGIMPFLTILSLCFIIVCFDEVRRLVAFFRHR